MNAKKAKELRRIARLHGACMYDGAELPERGLLQRIKKIEHVHTGALNADGTPVLTAEVQS